MQCTHHGRQTGDRHDQSRVGWIPAECLIAFYICLSKCRAWRRRLSEAVPSQEQRCFWQMSQWFKENTANLSPQLRFWLNSALCYGYDEQLITKEVTLSWRFDVRLIRVLKAKFRPCESFSKMLAKRTCSLVSVLYHQPKNRSTNMQQVDV